MRIAVGGIRHETNTFSPLRTGADDFVVWREAEIMRDPLWQSVLSPDSVLVPTLMAEAAPHGLVQRATYQHLKEELLARLQAALPVDGIYLDLHGAMKIDGIGDGESDLVGAIRACVGPTALIAASLDLHANVAPAVLAGADILTAYRTAPHRDREATRQRALAHLVHGLSAGIRPVAVLIKLPLLLPGEFAVTDVEPARSLYGLLEQVEVLPGILDASLLIGCAWTDAPHTAVSVIVVSERDRALAQEHAARVASAVWAQRAAFGPETPTMAVDEAIATALRRPDRAVFLSDAGDNVTAGGAGDSAVVTQRLLAARVTDAVVAGLADAPAVAACARVGVGAVVTTTVGGTLDGSRSPSLSVRGVVVHLDPPERPTLAVLRVGGVDIVVTADRRSFTTRASFAAAGIDPRTRNREDREARLTTRARRTFPDARPHRARSQRGVVMSIDPSSRALPAGLSGQAFASLLQAVQGLRNRDAILAMLGCTFVGVIVAGLLMATAGSLGFLAALLAFLVWIVAIGTGVNAAGLLQMDSARGISPRSLGDALVQGLMCIPKLIVLALALLAVEIVVFIGIALLLLICKIPFLGPLLFVVVFPVSVVVAGITVTGLFICGVLSLPAIWQGAGITRAFGQTLAIVKSRLLEAVLLLFALGFLCFVVGMIVFGILAAGMLPTMGMSMGIVGFGGLGMDSVMAMSQGGGGGHAVAGAIGAALLWAIAASLVGQVYLLGLSLVYLRVTDGLDLSASEASLRAAFDDARRRTAALGERARQATQRDNASPRATAPSSTAAPFAAAAPFSSAATTPRAGTPPLAEEMTTVATPRTVEGSGPDIDLPLDEPPRPSNPAYAPPAWKAASPAPAATPLPAAAPARAATTCPQCLSAIAAEDVFCGVCGYRLK